MDRALRWFRHKEQRCSLSPAQTELHVRASSRPILQKNMKSAITKKCIRHATAHGKALHTLQHTEMHHTRYNTQKCIIYTTTHRNASYTLQHTEMYHTYYNTQKCITHDTTHRNAPYTLQHKEMQITFEKWIRELYAGGVYMPGSVAELKF